uniref:Centrosomal protein 72 n=1 Tax=Oryzias sinensis TaxID=183150 RepID=A0A8C7XB05_9TELE
MATECLTTISEQWIRDRLQLKHPCLGDVRSLSLPGTLEERIGHLGNALNNFIRLKSLDLSYNALVSVEGLQHLKKLERLILYHNCIPSLEEVKTLFQLPVLRELDLRLNPLTKNCPHYRAYIVHALPSLRKLDSCSVRDTERKVAIMQFSSDLPPQQKRCSLNLAEDKRYAEHKISLMHKTFLMQALNTNLCRSPSLINIRPPSPLQSGLTLSESSNPILHPARLTYSSINTADGSTSLLCKFHSQGTYRKPLEMLLNLVDKHWRGERSLHHNNNFLSQAVQILSMMESDISSREAEVRTLRQDVDTLRIQAVAREEEHETEVRKLSAQLEETRRAEGKLNEQLRIVLEENVTLQKQLIKLERQYLKSMIRSSPMTQIRGGWKQRCFCTARSFFCLCCRSLVATNQCLLAELKGSGEHLRQI